MYFPETERPSSATPLQRPLHLPEGLFLTHTRGWRIKLNGCLLLEEEEEEEEEGEEEEEENLT